MCVAGVIYLFADEIGLKLLANYLQTSLIAKSLKIEILSEG